jgi:hypothetical protein
VSNSENEENQPWTPKYVVCRTAGSAEGPLVIEIGRSVCGDIMDGVALQREGERGGYVIAWADFERAYLDNKALREQLGPPYASLAEMLDALKAKT